MRIEKAFVQILGVRPRLFSPPANYTDNLNALLPIKDRGYTSEISLSTQ